VKGGLGLLGSAAAAFLGNREGEEGVGIRKRWRWRWCGLVLGWTRGGLGRERKEGDEFEREGGEFFGRWNWWVHDCTILVVGCCGESEGG